MDNYDLDASSEERKPKRTKNFVNYSSLSPNQFEKFNSKKTFEERHNKLLKHSIISGLLNYVQHKWGKT